MTHRIIIFALAATVFSLVGQSAMAFDGNQKGFVLGGGIGVAPWARWEGTTIGVDDTDVAPALHAMIGYGVSERLLITLGLHSALYRPNGFSYVVTPGLRSLDLRYYFGGTGRSFYVVSSVGYIASAAVDPADKVHRGFGYGGGAGYELSRTWQIGIMYVGGSQSDDDWQARDDFVSIVLTASPSLSSPFNIFLGLANS